MEIPCVSIQEGENGTTTKTVTYTDFGSSLGSVSGATSSVNITYSNGYTATSYYDKYGNLLAVKEGSTTKETFSYDSGRNLLKRVDNYAGKTYNIVYTNWKITSISDGTLTVTQEYDGYNEADGISYAYEGYTDSYSQEKDALGRVTAETTPLGTVSYSYDTMGRLTSRTAYGKTESYTYKDGSTSGYTTPLVEKLTYSDGTAYNYTYDSEGKITQITNKSGVLVAQFEYDSLKRLSQETIYGQKIVTYTYNVYGDISAKVVYSYTTSSLLNDGCWRNTYSYTYSATGKLTKVTCETAGGTATTTSTCSYDANGNPTTYLGNTLTWTRGRLLASYGSNTYSYNADGIRFQKNDTEYILDGNRILAEVENGTVTKRYFYDGNGIAGMEYGGSKYYFRKNLQGDVVSVLNESGTSVASYTYDAWGAVISSSGTMAGVNPFRYRGYYYDTETKLYYLQSRYYDPSTGRFLNPDTYSYSEPETLHGLNLYVYCNNNPVMYVDETGHSWGSFWNGIGNWFQDNWVKLTIGTVFIVAGALVTFFTAGMGTAGLLAAGSALLASAKAVGISMAVSAGVGAVVGGITGGWEGALQGFGDGLADGFMWGGIFAGSAQILGGVSKLLASRNVNFSDKFNWLFGNRNSQSTTLLRVNRGGKQLFRIDASVKELWHLHYGATSTLMRIHRTGIVLFGYLGIANVLKGLLGDF